MANVVPIDIVAPGAKGLNTEAANTLLDPKWATVALNAVVNRSGRMAARKGWASATTTGISGDHLIDTLFEFLEEDGTSTVISCANNEIYKNLDDFTNVANNLTSTTAPTADHWKFVNFNNKILGFQRGHTAIVRTSGDFADQSLTTTGQPGSFDEGNEAVAAFGRVWMVDADLQTIRYSVLLDDTDYSSASGGGWIDMSSVWTQGMDEIVALAVIGSNLVCFGKNHIVLWADGSGSEIGLDPTNIEVVDTIEGTGCIARDSVANTGEGDLLFLSRHGVQSLGRVIESKSNPIVTLSKNVNADMLEAIKQSRASDAELDRVRAIHSPEQGMYIINFPTISKQFVFDTNHQFEDNDGAIVFPVTTWNLGGDIAGMVSLTGGQLYFGSNGVVGLYSTNQDNGSAYDFQYESGWLDFGDPQLNHRLKMLKEILASVSIGDGSIAWTWEFDFSGTTLQRLATYSGSTSAEFNVAEFNVDEFSGAVTIQRKNLPAHGEGQFIKLGATASVNGFDMVVQHISIAPKIGRMVT